jgi:hypothetical protein
MSNFPGFATRPVLFGAPLGKNDETDASGLKILAVRSLEFLTRCRRGTPPRGIPHFSFRVGRLGLYL